MTERFVTNAGTISVATNASIVVGTGTLFSGRDRAGARVVAYPAASVPVPVGTVAEVTPRGIYDNLSLPLVTPYKGTALVNVPYELVDGPAIANGSTQAAIFARYAAHLEQNMGLVGNSADTIDVALIPNNSLFVDDVTQRIFQWRNGVMQAVRVTVSGIELEGDWNSGTAYKEGNVVSEAGTAYLSLADNTNVRPSTHPATWSVFVAKGDKGDIGPQGLMLRHGTGAPSNAVGADGEFYIADDTHFLYGPKGGGVWPAGFNTIGPPGGTGAGGSTGPAGADGKTLRSGTVAPSSLTGNDGDYYIDRAALMLYGPKSLGTWPAGVSILGPQGIQGNAGQGIQPGATGTLAQRVTSDNQPLGFLFLQTDVAPFLLWAKASNTTGDWTGPTPVGGTAPVGDMGHITDAVVQSFDYGHIA